MGPRRRLIAGLALAAAGVAGWLAVPRRFTVDGVSMGPALLPGDVVRTGAFPACDRLRRPRRFERWVLAATDGLAIKRVVGLPGEEVSIVDGDLAIDGAVVLKGPRLLAEMGSVVAHGAAGDAVPLAPGWAWAHAGDEVLDDAEFDTGTSRRLTPVRDAGFTAILDVREPAGHAVTVRTRVGETVVEQKLRGPGRHALAAGRLDGRVVLATWRMPVGAGAPDPRSSLPAGAPDSWQVSIPGPKAGADDSTPAVALGWDDGSITVVEVARWRDIAYRPAADGRDAWSLGVHEVLVLGDHPPASTDSRRWGPVDLTMLRHRIAARVR